LELELDSKSQSQSELSLSWSARREERRLQSAEWRRQSSIIELEVRSEDKMAAPSLARKRGQRGARLRRAGSAGLGGRRMQTTVWFVSAG